MTWPTVAIGTANADAGTDSPALARTEILDALTKLNQMMAHVSAFAATLLDDADAAGARSTLGTEIYKDVPIAVALTAGECFSTAAGLTLNTGLAASSIYAIYNNSAAAFTITQGSGLTLRLAGTTTTGNRTLAPRGLASVLCLSTTEYVMSGAGVS